MHLPRPFAAGLWLAAAILSGPDPLAGPPVLPFDEVVSGMTGVGRTVFEGDGIETFDVEILGKLPGIGPDQNLILARLSGGPLDHTGVLAGMSGSPIFIDDRLVGAVAYSWGFAKEAIAGVTPIEEMLALTRPDAGDPARAAGFAPGDLDALGALHSVERLQSFLSDLAAGLVATRSSTQIPIPLAVSGLGSAGLARLSPELTGAGFFPVQAAGAGAGAEVSPPLEPGSPMGLKLVRGDVEMTATGTVTWVDGDRVLGFGHPLFGLGAIDLPLTGARVEALVPSVAQSMRMARPLSEVGALRQDRAAGVFGTTGAEAAMIPVRLRLTGGDLVERSFSFDVADDPQLSPLLLYYALKGIVSSRERVFGNATVRLLEGSVIKMFGGEDVNLDNLFAGPAAFDYGTGIPAYVLYLLMGNTWSRPQIAGVNLLLDYEDVPRTARIRRVALDRYRVVAGETVEVTMILSPYRGPDKTIRREIAIPEETPAGVLEIVVGGALSVSRSSQTEQPLVPRDLEQLIALINQLRRNDRVYLLATRREPGVVLDGVSLPNLPPSATTILTRPPSQGHVNRAVQRTVLEEVVLTDHAVSGSARIQLEVIPQ